MSKNPPSSEVLSADAAVARLVASVSPLSTTLSLPVLDCLGRVLAVDVATQLDNPPHDNSAMDGYGVRLADLAPTGMTTLTVGLRVAAGDALGPHLPPGQAARIFTGAFIPDGVDTVIPQEVCQTGEGTVTVPRPQAVGENIRRRGEDFSIGQVVLSAGKLLRPQEIGLAAAIGQSHLAVMAQPKVAFFSTGNEVCDPGQPLKAGGIYDSNRYTMLSMLRQMGCQPLDMGILPDDRDAIIAALQGAQGLADVIMTAGGVSVGEEDHVKPAVEALGRIDFWRVAIRPGRPVAFGQVGTTPFIGLPGNPVSGMVCFLIFARPFLARLAGRANWDVPGQMVPADFAFHKKPGRREWLRGWLRDGRAVAFPNQGSGLITSMVAAQGLIDVPEDSPGFEPGQMVRFLSFAEFWS